MTAIEILESIIENNGSCDWVTRHDKILSEDICNLCPLGFDKNGKPVACYYNVKTSATQTPAELDSAYVEAAKKKLIDLLMEEILLGTKQKR